MTTNHPHDAVAEDHDARTPVMVRVADILDCFEDPKETLTLTSIVTQSGLPRSTAFRLLTQLVELGWVERHVRGYRLGPRVIEFGSRRPHQSRLREAAHPVLNDLHIATGGIVHLGVLEDDGRVQFLDKVGILHSRAFPSYVGLRYPVERTAGGKAILAAMPPGDAEAVIAMRERETGLPLDRLREELVATRRRSCAGLMNGRSEAQAINSVGAPIVGPDGPVGSVSIGCPDLAVDAFIPAVLMAARRIAARLYSTRATRAMREHSGDGLASRDRSNALS